MSKKKLRKRRLFGWMLLVPIVLTACLKGYVPDEGIEIEEANLEIEKPKVKEAIEGRKEIERNVSTQKEEKPIPYNVPVEEIVGRLEYVYQLGNKRRIDEWDFGELGPLPKQGVIDVSFYAVEGNKILFLPKGKGNTEVFVGDRACEVYESEEIGEYLFYRIREGEVYEYGVPLMEAEKGGLRYCSIKKEREKEEEIKERFGRFEGEYLLKDLVWLGEAEVNMELDETFRLPPIEAEENEYIRVLLNDVVERIKEEKQYGSYDIYIKFITRTPEGREGEGTKCWIAFAVVGEGLKRSMLCIIYDHGDIGGVWPMGDDLYREVGSRGEMLADKAIKNARAVIHLDIREDTEIPLEEEMRYEELEKGRDYSKLSLEEAMELIGYAWSYGEWFGMNELGYQDGEVRGFGGREVIVFRPKYRDDRFYFRMADEEEEIYYRILRNKERQQEGQIETGLIRCWEKETYMDGIGEEIGRGRIEEKELPEWGVEKIKEDEYTVEMEKYIKEKLKEGGEKGEYEICFGEYEALFRNKVCLSAAVTGEKEYYIRCLIVKYGEGKYYFWPIGFGLDGSLEECESERHHMNKVCIERTKQLERHIRKITVEE